MSNTVDFAAAPDPALGALASAVLAMAGVRRGNLVADVASGSGRWTRPAAAAAASTGRVLAFGPSTASFGDALSRVHDAAWAPVHRCLARADSLPLPNRSADTVIWVTDPGVPSDVVASAGLSELSRVARPGCRVVVSFAGGPTDVPLHLFAERGLAIAHVSDERWGTAPLALVAARRA